jgi:hypothetical protein
VQCAPIESGPRRRQVWARGKRMSHGATN